MKPHKLLILMLLFSFWQKSHTQSDVKAQEVVNKAIEVMGGKKLQKSKVSFTFRDRDYLIIRNKGQFQYERLFTEKDGRKIRDVYYNKGFYREINGSKDTVNATRSNAFSNSINSVVYFALLPFNLNDPAANKKYLGEVEIEGQFYHKIKVTFAAAGGGKDHEDEYIYWFQREQFTLDYLAYNYVVDGGGARFRKAINPRIVNGVRFVDYINMKPIQESRDVAIFDQLFAKQNLVVLSRIELVGVKVE
jgi:hypothetical protein